MPQWIEEIRNKIKDSLKREYPNRSEDWYESTSWAIVKKREKAGKLTNK